MGSVDPPLPFQEKALNIPIILSVSLSCPLAVSYLDFGTYDFPPLLSPEPPPPLSGGEERQDPLRRRMVSKLRVFNLKIYRILKKRPALNFWLTTLSGDDFDDSEAKPGLPSQIIRVGIFSLPTIAELSGVSSQLKVRRRTC